MAAVINAEEDAVLCLQRGRTEANRSRRSAVNFRSGDLGQTRALGRPIGPPPRWNFQ